MNAKRILLMAVLAVLLATLIFAQAPCPDQVYLPLTGYAVALDAAQIALDRTEPNDPDYAIRKPLLLQVSYVAVGTPALRSGRACDPDGEPVKLRCQDGTLTMLDPSGTPIPKTPVNGWYTADPAGYYRWSFTPTVVGITYHWMEARDIRVETNDARSTRGTVVVVAIPKNRPPSLCGGLP